MRSFIITLTLLLGSIYAMSSNALPNTYKIRKYTTVDGLTNNVVYDILQDKKGFLWLATEDGLNRFDGYRFVSYRNDPSNRHSISQNIIQTIHCDENGDIWVGTADCGLNKYSYEKDCFTIYRHNPKDINSINGDDITCITSSHDGNLWIASYRNGINLYDKARNSFIRHKEFLSQCRGNGNYRVISVFESRNRIVWTGTQGNGVYAYDLTRKQPVKIEGVDLSSSTIYEIKEDKQSNIWIGTNNGVTVLTRKNGNYECLHKAPDVDGKTVNSIICDRSNNMWIGTEKGIYVFNLYSYLNNKPLNTRFIDESNTPTGLSYRSVRSIFEDRDYNIWIGTFTGGLNFISATPDKFSLLTKDMPANALSYNKVWGMCQDKQGNLWIGTDGSGIDKYDINLKKLGNFHSIPSNPGTLSNNSVLSACCDKEGILWFGTYEGGLNRVDPKTNTIKRYLRNGTNTSISDNIVRSIFEDSKQNLWIGTDIGGVCKLDKSRSHFTFYNTSNSSISENAVRAIAEDRKGNLWLGTYGEGLNVLSPNGKISTFKHSPDIPSTINSNNIQTLLVDSKGRLWIGTNNGLCLFNESQKRFKSYTETDGLINNSIVGIAEDKNHTLWLSTVRGISRFNPGNEKFENYDHHDGLQSGQFLTGSILRCSNGNILFGGTNGLNIINPAKLSGTKSEPEVVITELQIFNAKVPIVSENNPDSPLEQNISTTKEIRLRYKQNTITLGFVAISYSNPEKTQYAYLMEGVDKEWNMVGNQHSATYRYLSPGKYVFRVRATNQDGVWSPKESRLIIVVKPPFWLTWWAYIFYFIVAMLLLNAGLRLYTFRIRTMNELRIAHIEQQKAEEIHQAKLQFFTNISHEFRTPLTLIIGPLEKFIKTEPESDRQKQYMMMFRNANRLLRLINQLLDLRKMENNVMQLRVQEMNLTEFLEETIFSFEELSYRKNINLRISGDKETISGWLDPEFLDKILYNLLSNAFKFTPSGGDIEISAHRLLENGNNVVKITVKDSGKGMNPDELERIFELFYQVPGSKSSLQKGTGIGLHLTKALVTLHKGTIELSSEPDNGTTIELTLPLDKNAYTEAEITHQPVELSFEDEVSSLGQEPVSESNSDKAKHLNRLYTVLIVEDDDDIRRYMRDELKPHYNILEAKNGMEGLEMASTHLPDLVITDVMMPVMDGVEVCRELKQNISTSHIPIIMLTAKTTIEDRIVGLENGADSYIPKPFNPMHLKTRIAKLIETREMLKEKFSRSISFQAKEVVTTSPDEEFLQKALNLIHKNMSNSEYNGDMLSKDLGMSRANLHRKLKSLLGQSSSEFIRIIRLKQAAILLKQKNFTVAEVGYEVGFNSPTYFTTSFSNYFKMSPSEYIAKNS